MHRRVALAACVCSLCAASSPVDAQPRRGVLAELRYQGMFEDRVTQGAKVSPDGKPDGRFRLVLESGALRKVVHVLLRSCDSRGVITGRAAWDTDAARLWIVGVFRAGKSLPVGKGRFADALRGRAVYDLFVAAPANGFQPGEHYCALATFDDGMGVWARATITPPVPASLKWVGTDKDRVGQGDKDKPDGMPDGHFVLTLKPGPRKVQLTSLRLVELGADDKPIAAQAWSSAKNPRGILAVERRGKRLNWGGRSFRDDVTGSTDYDLFAAPRQPFREGARYQVVAGFAEDAPAAAVAMVIRPARPVTGPVTLGLTYQGFAGDRVGTEAKAGPDGQKDARFTLSIDTGGRELSVDAIELSVSDDKGNTWRKTWDTRPGGHWILGVERAGKRLNPTDIGIPLLVSDKTTLVLWAANDAWKDPRTGAMRSYFTKGGYFTVRVYWAKHPTVIQTIRLP